MIGTVSMRSILISNSRGSAVSRGVQLQRQHLNVKRSMQSLNLSRNDGDLDLVQYIWEAVNAIPQMCVVENQLGKYSGIGKSTIWPDREGSVNSCFQAIKEELTREL